MAFIPVPDVALVEFRMLLDSQKVENTLYFQKSTGWDATSLDLAGVDLKEWWTDSYAPLVSDLVTLREVVLTDLETDTGAQATFAGAGAAGSQIGGSAPSNVSFAVSFRTALRGRAFRGRNYIVGVPLPQLSDINHVESSWANDVVDAYFGLISLAAGFDAQWVAVSRFSGVDPDTHAPIPRTEGIATPITSVITTDLTLDSQRRRLPGRGQ